MTRTSRVPTGESQSLPLPLPQTPGAPIQKAFAMSEPTQRHRSQRHLTDSHSHLPTVLYVDLKKAAEVEGTGEPAKCIEVTETLLKTTLEKEINRIMSIFNHTYILGTP